MNFATIAARTPPEPWGDAEKIPWHEPGFSQRMLREHLSQAHHAASRRTDVIARQVAQIHTLAGDGTRILDLGCGPGLYTQRLAQRGHPCVGIDISPASIEHARRAAKDEGLDCEYRQLDMREADFAGAFGLALLLFGELNAFRPDAARAVVRAAARSLEPGGRLLLEVHTEEAVRDVGQRGPVWYSRDAGLFSDEPHLVLRESRWDPERRASVERHWVIDAASGATSVFASSLQAYTPEEYASLLIACGFEAPAAVDDWEAGVGGLHALHGVKA